MREYTISPPEKVKRNLVFIDMARSSANWSEKTKKMEKAIQLYTEEILNTAYDFGFITDETNFTGDGMLLSFNEENVIDAVNCGWMIHNKWWQMGGHLLFLRVGIHFGEINIYTCQHKSEGSLPLKKMLCGNDLNRTARIMDSTKGSEKLHSNFDILISDRVEQLLEKYLNTSILQYISAPIKFEFEKGKLKYPDISYTYRLQKPIYIDNLSHKKPIYLKNVCDANSANNDSIFLYRSNQNENIKSIELLRKSINIIESLPNDLFYLNSIYKRNLAAILMDHGENTEALAILKALDIALEKYPFDSPHHKFVLAEAFRLNNYFDKAIENYNIAKIRYPIDDPMQLEIQKGIINCRSNLIKE